MKKGTILILLIITVQVFGQAGLSISENRRYIIKEDGTPFFWLGDTAWELFHRLDREEARFYLQNRADKGFTVIQAVILAELNGLNEGNAYGDKPLFDNDPAKPNDAYFSHVDYIINTAEDMGIVIGLLPTWGDKFHKLWGVGPEVFTPGNAEIFGEYVGKRYQNKPVVWILGGDRHPGDDEDRAITHAMAKGIRKYDTENLMTYHPTGGHWATEYFNEAKWLDFDFYQSGHHKRMDPGYLIRYNTKSLALSPKRPVINGEPNYEDHPVNWLRKGEQGWFDDFDCRYAAYISLMTGACGHTYGNHNIWQMWDKEHDPISFARTRWPRALDHLGAYQMGYVRALFESMDWARLITGTSRILNETAESFQIQCLAENKQSLLAYTADGTALNIDLSVINKDKVTASWFNPRDGESWNIGEFETTESQSFKPHAHGNRSDWVLILK